tara:strand:- start:1824 stop:2222 length:399 start_codon:yes stop_codon:yes gene_type:complete
MTINIFRKTILLQIFLFLLAISLGITEGVLHGYEEVDSDITMTEGILFLFIILLLPFMWYFLYKLKPIGKKLFIFYLILGAISFFVMSDDSYIFTNVTPLTRFLDLIENGLILLDGVILGFLFFTDVKEKFE